jgi:hypothetical protein
MQRKQSPQEVAMHPTLISTLADELVRERSRGRGVNGLSRPLSSRRESGAPRRARRAGIRLALRRFTPGERREALP